MTSITLLEQLSLADVDPTQWQTFRPGVDIIPLHGEPTKAGASALLRYQPGATVPNHLHHGVEHIFVLSGSQEDHFGHHTVGQLVINPAGSSHRVSSPDGCVVLAIWSGDLELIPEG